MESLGSDQTPLAHAVSVRSKVCTGSQRLFLYSTQQSPALLYVAESAKEGVVQVDTQMFV